MGRGKKAPAPDERAEGIEITDGLEDGRGVARLPDGRVLFIEGGVPGDRADVRFWRRGRREHHGVIERLADASPLRRTPPCRHFDDCGGCKWQHMAYAGQAAQKEKRVFDALDRIGGVAIGERRPILAAPEEFFYRNKLEFTFSARRWVPRHEASAGGVAPGAPQPDERVLGFHVAGLFDKVLDIDTCWLQEARVNEVRNAVRDYARAEALPFFDLREQTGLLRTLIFRSSRATGELMLILVLAQDAPEVAEAVFSHLAARFDFITSYLWIYNPKRNDSYAELPVRAWRGPAHLTERLSTADGRAYEFAISPTSFFQTNPAQTERLYGLVRAHLREPVPVLYDLYCGAGSIGIFVQDKAARIVGVEYSAAAVADAAKNAARNGLAHLTFEAGDMAAVLTEDFAARHGAPDAIITDPPRAGMDERVVRRLLALAAPRIVHVSCNPATLARDLALLSEGYAVATVQPVDMFPQTGHVEAVALLERR